MLKSPEGSTTADYRSQGEISLHRTVVQDRVVGFSKTRETMTRTVRRDNADIPSPPAPKSALHPETLFTAELLRLSDELLGESLLTVLPTELQLKPGYFIEKMRKVPAELWSSPAVKLQLARLDEVRAALRKDLHSPTMTKLSLDAVCTAFVDAVDNWVAHLIVLVQQCGVGNRAARKAATLLLGKRRTGLTMIPRLREFSRNPCEKTLQALARSLSMLYFLRNVATH